MPQLNPAPWFYTFLFTWIITFRLLKLMVGLYVPKTPMKLPHPHQLTPLCWTWR